MLTWEGERGHSGTSVSVTREPTAVEEALFDMVTQQYQALQGVW